MDDATTLNDLVASEIRAWMGRRRLTGRQLALAVDASQTWMATRLRGETEISLNDLERIAQALDVQVAALLPQAADRPRGVDRIAYPAQPERSAPRATRLLLAAPHATPVGTPGRADIPEPGADRSGVRRPAIRAWRHEGVPA